MVARNSLINIAGQFALKVITFAFAILVVRKLGEHDFGKYSTAAAFVGVFAVFSDMGMAGLAVREIARDRARATAMFVNMIAIRLLLSVVVLAGSLVLAWLLGYPTDTIALIALASLGLFFYAVQGPLEAVLEGFERYDITTLGRVANQLAFVGAAIALLWLGWGPAGIIVASFIGLIAAMVMMARLAYGLFAIELRFDVGTWKPLIRAGVPFAISTFTMLLSFKADTILLSIWRSPSEVGWYSAAYNLIFSLLIPLTGFTGVLVPSLSRQYHEDSSRVVGFYVQAIRLSWMTALPAAVGISLLSDRLIVLLYGETFLRAGEALQILIWVLPILAVTSLCGSIAIVLHRERAAARVNAVNAVFNITVNLWAIQQFGLLGAAVMTVVTELVGFGQMTHLLREVLSFRTVAGVLRQSIPAAAVMGAIVWLARPLPLVPLVLLGAVSYAAALVLTRGITLGEVKLLSRAAGTRFTRRPAAAG
jgi:O-antigen/teichoic acid export membrane protein